MQDYADARPHDNEQVTLDVDDMDSYLLQGLEPPLQQTDCMLDAYTYLQIVSLVECKI